MKKPKEEAVWEAARNLKKLEAITENTLQKYGRVSDRLAEKLQFAQINYAVAKDDLHDPYMQDD